MHLSFELDSKTQFRDTVENLKTACLYYKIKHANHVRVNWGCSQRLANRQAKRSRQKANPKHKQAKSRQTIWQSVDRIGLV